MAKDLNAKIDRDLSKRGIPHYSEPIYRSSAKAFHKAIRRAKMANKNAWMVDVHTRNEYRGMKTFLSRDGMSGVAITKTGDIVSVFSFPKSNNGNRVAQNNAMGSLIPFAIAHGGKKLDCYAGGLENMYARFGAKATGQVAFNKEYAPPGWKEGMPTPPVAAMIMPSYQQMLLQYDRTRRVDMAKVKTYDDYEVMINARDATITRGSASASVNELISG